MRSFFLALGAYFCGVACVFGAVYISRPAPKTSLEQAKAEALATGMDDERRVFIARDCFGQLGGTNLTQCRCVELEIARLPDNAPDTVLDVMLRCDLPDPRKVGEEM
jgi:hypothetical protein